MVNWKLSLLNSAGITQKEYIIEGGLAIKDRVSQTTSQISFPRGKYDRTLLNSLLGQKRNLQVSFLLLQRSDDYTNGSGTPGDGSPETQRDFIWNYIFTAGGYHIFRSEHGELIQGRIQDIDSDRSSDDPFVQRISMTFLVGIQPV